jgi:hypothetical protein
MDNTAGSARQPSGWETLPLPARQEPEVRRRLSGPALRTFFSVARVWELTTTEARALLGWPAPSTFHKYKAGDHGTLPYDTLVRLSLVLGIYKSLQLLYPEPRFADRWMRMPNANALFDGVTPLDFVADGGIDALYHVRRLLDGRRG